VILPNEAPICNGRRLSSIGIFCEALLKFTLAVTSFSAFCFFISHAAFLRRCIVLVRSLQREKGRSHINMDSRLYSACSRLYLSFCASFLASYILFYLRIWTVEDKKSIAPEPAWMTWRRENSLPYRESNSDPLAVQLIANRYTDWDISAPHRRVRRRRMFLNVPVQRHVKKWLAKYFKLMLYCLTETLIKPRKSSYEQVPRPNSDLAVTHYVDMQENIILDQFILVNVIVFF
jgi:hypothetical protein